MQKEISLKCNLALLLAFLGLFGFLYVVLGSVFACLACASILVSVKLHIGMREVRMSLSSTVKEIQKKAFPHTSSTTLQKPLLFGLLLISAWKTTVRFVVKLVLVILHLEGLLAETESPPISERMKSVHHTQASHRRLCRPATSNQVR